MKIARNAILIVLCLHYYVCKAQKQETSFSDRYHHSHYTDENGLPQNSVKSIAADRAGFIWLATENGVVRFDGQQFYTFNRDNTNIRDMRFYGFQHDLNGKSDRLHTFPPDEHGEALRIENGNAALDSVHGQTVNSKLIDFDGKRGIDRFMGAGLPGTSLERISAAIPEYTIQCSSGVGSYFEIWRDKVRFFARWKMRWEKALENLHFENYFGVNNELFRFSDNGAIQQITSAGIRNIGIGGDLPDDPSYKPGKINFRIFWNNTSSQVFVLLNKKFYLLETGPGKKWNSTLILDGFDFESNNICTAYFDRRDERLFLGSTTRGLFVIRLKQFQTLQVSDRDDDNIMYAQTLYGSGRVLSPSGFVLGIEKDGAFYKQKLPAIYKHAGLDRRGILTDASGNIWAKMFGQLRKFSPDGGKVLAMWNFGNEIRTVFKSDDGRIWAGLADNGLFQVQDLGSQMRPIAFLKKKIKRIAFLLQAGPDSLWMGTEHGLYRLSLKTGRTHFVAGTEKLLIRSLYVSPGLKDGVFITTYGDGVFLYRNRKLTRFPLDENKNLGATHCIVEDKKGFFWMTTNKGLFQFAKADLLAYSQLASPEQRKLNPPFYLYYTKENGFATNEFDGGCQPCAVTLPDGRVSLPSLNGLVWFDPLQVHAELPTTALVFDRIEEQGKPHLLRNDTITFGLAPKQISLHVTTPYFGNQDNVRFAYALVESGEIPGPTDWIRLKAADPVIRFSELGSGEYSLTVRKVNGFGQNNYKTKRITLVVPKQWFETDWFRVLCLLALGLAIYFYIKVRTAYLQVQNRVLEERVSSKTQRLELALAALQTSEAERSKQMNIHTHLLASISHDIRTPLKYILNLSERVEDLIEKEDMEMVSRITSDVATSSRRIFNLLDNMLAYIRTQVNHDRIKMHHVSLRQLVQEKASLFFNIMEEQENCFFNDVPGGYLVNSNGHLLGVIIHNLIDNANKNTFDGSIRIFTEIHDPYLHLVIADSGLGMPASIRNWLNGVMDPEQDDSGYDEKKGLGLSIVKELAESIDVRLRVEVKNGTRVHIIFDLADQVPIG